MKTTVPGNLITIFGRNPVLEALEDPRVTPWRLHLSTRNRPADILDRIVAAARQRGIEIHEHDPLRLSRISRNARQDQGVALDIMSQGYRPASSLLEQPTTRCCLLAVDRIHNPQNLGMIIRSVAAGFMDGLLLPREGTTGLGPLCIKASAGTAFRAPIYHCDSLPAVLPSLKEAGFSIYTLKPRAEQDIFQAVLPARCILVLGNESDGVQPAVEALADGSLCIPMRNSTESLNVAATASILSFLPALRP